MKKIFCDHMWLDIDISVLSGPHLHQCIYCKKQIWLEGKRYVRLLKRGKIADNLEGKIAKF
jgi:hypothetical protein